MMPVYRPPSGSAAVHRWSKGPESRQIRFRIFFDHMAEKCRDSRIPELSRLLLRINEP